VRQRLSELDSAAFFHWFLHLFEMKRLPKQQFPEASENSRLKARCFKTNDFLVQAC
jgi:hypothetical protein